MLDGREELPKRGDDIPNSPWQLFGILQLTTTSVLPGIQISDCGLTGTGPLVADWTSKQGEIASELVGAFPPDKEGGGRGQGAREVCGIEGVMPWAPTIEYTRFQHRRVLNYYGLTSPIPRCTVVAGKGGKKLKKYLNVVQSHYMGITTECVLYLQSLMAHQW